jgi:hypothetical protein
MSRELNLVGWTLHYICRGRGSNPDRSSHLSTLKIEFLTTKVLDKKNLLPFVDKLLRRSDAQPNTY